MADLKALIAWERRYRKPLKVIRWKVYCNWAYVLKFANVGPPHSKYGYPSFVLGMLRELIPGDITGETLEDAFEVGLRDFCEGLQMPQNVN